MGKRAAKAEDTSQSRKRQKSEQAELEGGDIGIIESVSLCNFMCHENLSFEFGPHINFIIGRNGSGKSAILTGIILALGGRSSVTGRYPNIKGFIKEGKQKAKIEVALRNRGDHPYKPDLYGTKVIVVREINLDGVSSYKLKSAAGKVISTHKEELNNILNAMDIQIENPVSLLTQENSRSFLMSKKPDKLYQFYYQGSGLEALEKSYNTVQIMYTDAFAELQRKQEMLPEMAKELKTWKKIIDTSTKVHHYKLELLWANVIEMERQLHEKEEELRKVEKQQSIYQREHDNCKNKLTEKTSTLVELQKKRKGCETMTQSLRQNLAELKNKRDSLLGVLRTLDAQLAASRRKLTATGEEIASLQSSFNENSRRNQTDENEEKRCREMEIENLKNECENCSETVKVLELERVERMEYGNKLSGDIANKQYDISNCSYSLQKHEKLLMEAEVASQNKVNVFGDQTANVLMEIQRQEHRFLRLPKGPIGRYLMVRDLKWCNAVEECISTATLKAYCCDNVKDSTVLTEILKKFYPPHLPSRPSIIITRYLATVHDVSRNRPQTGFPTCLDMLKIADPVIANVLIDTVSIESKVLIEDTKTAVDVMIKNPKNCYGAILMDCSTIALNPYRYYSNSKQRRKSVLSSIGKSDIQSLKKLVTESRSVLLAFKSELECLSNESKEIPDQVAALDRKIVALRHKMRKASAKIQDLQSFQDPKGTHGMEEELQQLKLEYDSIHNEVQQNASATKKCNEELECVVNQLNKHRELLKETTELFHELCSELNSCGQDKETLTLAVNKYQKEFKDASDRLEPLKNEVDGYQQAVESALNHAEAIGPRIETDRRPEDVRRLLNETEKFVEEQSNCNREELQQKYVEKYENLKQAKKKLAEKEKIVEHIDQMFKQRKLHFKKICYYTEHIIQMAYIHHLNKYYSGKLIFNSKARTLTLEAMPNKTGSETKKKGGKCSSLSGGERSFVTIAFLLAMWDRIKSPFKILDEYDVFMDSNNRNLSIGLLTEQAENLPDSQFIFLSPLDLPEIKHSPNIKVHQMLEPLRESSLL